MIIVLLVVHSIFVLVEFVVSMGGSGGGRVEVGITGWIGTVADLKGFAVVMDVPTDVGQSLTSVGPGFQGDESGSLVPVGLGLRDVVSESFSPVGLGVRDDLESRSFGKNDGMMPLVGVMAWIEAEIILRILEGSEADGFWVALVVSMIEVTGVPVLFVYRKGGKARLATVRRKRTATDQRLTIVKPEENDIGQRKNDY